jgi:calcineurin-like phosphoesterase family protein
MNRSHRARNKTSFKGVCFIKSVNKYVAMINVNKKRVYLGRYPTAEEASKAYEKASKELRGEFHYGG